jgi:DNA-binding transcriptional ArsR family regulator
MSISLTLHALSDNTRRRILELLKKKDLPVGEIHGYFDLAGASLSHHLSVLKQAGLVSARRKGQQIIYSLNMSVLEEIIEKLNKLYTK